MVTDSDSILARWRNHFCQLLNVHRVNDVRQTEIHTAAPLVPESSASEVELAIEKLKSHKSLGTDLNPAEMIKGGGRTIHSEIHKLIISIWNEEELPEESSLYLFAITMAIKKTVIIIGAYHFCQLSTKLYPTSCCQGYLHMQRKLLGIIKVDFDATGQPLIIYYAFIRY